LFIYELSSKLKFKWPFVQKQINFDESLAQLQQLLLKHDEDQGQLLLNNNSCP